MIKSTVNPALTLSTMPASWSASALGINVDNLHVLENDHKPALITALKNGCNVIYSSNNDLKHPTDVLNSVLSNHFSNSSSNSSGSNSSEGESEAMSIERSSLIYIQRTKPMQVKELEDSAKFIRDQLAISKERMEISTLDVMLLHVESATTKEQLESALEQLEQLVDEGALQRYGISSPLLLDNNGQVPIESIVQSKRYPNLSFFEFPFNLQQHQAATAKLYDGGSQSLCDWAAQNDIATINSSPSYFTNPATNKQSRFCNVDSHTDRDLPKILKDAFDLAIHLEIINPIFKDTVQMEAVKRNPNLIGQLRWAHMLVYDAAKYDKLSNYWVWRKLLAQRIRPSVNDAVLSVFSNHIMNSWGGGYRKAINSVFDLYTYSLEAGIHQQQRALEQEVRRTAAIAGVTLPDEVAVRDSLIQVALQLSQNKTNISIEDINTSLEAKRMLVLGDSIKALHFTNDQVSTMSSAIKW
ncbi:hypothetical protein SAMD00019534_024920 [Acytostelium subglobosum LB1]|uniref:hypothetical protein n=1 Tax=Acytostelium subglobosum LB1 TaxID=1410327 RepID=UPI000644B911|nr:hypothetical protein SAMD00019534_024920 [Acytostelium subglobosum LB1]GAM19317.1 hypothetical protein SAMD00019534_024920 [Acytostelium subglobosum LB1]|eukprot:XP_012757244.1 hypothetical protein SAMD00019534_024920 [Acytostelium subglobosum LB1]